MMARALRKYVVTRIWFVDARSQLDAMRKTKQVPHTEVYAQLEKSMKRREGNGFER